jgi:large subunit ribosomal protein L9
MDVILLKDVEKVGLRGEVVGVARGYARNFLLPRKLAEVATPAKVAEVERRDAQRARSEANTTEQAQKVAALLNETELRFDVASGETGTLFGSVTPTDIADELWSSKKIRVDRRKIDLPDPIKRIGRYTVPIEVFPGVVAEVRTLVVPVGGELPPEEPEVPEEEAAAPEAEAAPAAEAEAAPAAEAEAEAAPVQAEEPAPALSEAELAWSDEGGSTDPGPPRAVEPTPESEQ